MNHHNPILSLDEDIDTFQCPKCKALWRAKGYYNYDEGGWVYEDFGDRCPRGCYNFFGFTIRGKLIDKV